MVDEYEFEDDGALSPPFYQDPQTMPTANTTQPQTPLAEKLDKLHEKVNAMLDVPLPKEGDAWPLPEAADVPDDTAAPKPLDRAGPT